MEMYSAHVEVARKGDRLDVDEVMEGLEPFHGVVGTTARGWASVQLSVPGESLAQAAAAAIAVTERVLGASAVACEVLTEVELGAREGWVPVPDLVSVSEAAELLGVSRQRVLQRVGDGSLPASRVGRDYVLARAAVEAAASGAVS